MTGERPRRLRLFVAVEVPAAVRSEVSLARRPLQAEAGALRWTDPDGWHLTLAFLGWTDAGRVAEVERVLAAVAAAAPPVPLRLTGRAGTFRRDVLWAGLEDAPALAALAAAVQQALAEIGVPRERRPFSAHLTLARGRRDAPVPPRLAQRYDGPTTRWTVRELLLQRSYPGPAGARYEVLRAWPLAGAADAGRTNARSL